VQVKFESIVFFSVKTASSLICQLLQVYKEPFCKRHYISVCSFTFLFRLLGYLSCIFLAIIVSHASGDIWIEHKVTTAQPDVKFRYKALAHFAVCPAAWIMARQHILRSQVLTGILPV
jgi:hypothetical protein